MLAYKQLWQVSRLITDQTENEITLKGLWPTYYRMILWLADIGKTGVHLRYHKRHEYNKLTSEQKDELQEWRTKQRKRDTDKKLAATHAGGSKRYTKKQISSIVSAKIDEELKKREEEGSDSQKLKTVLAAIEAGELVEKPPATVAHTQVKKVTLKSILRQAKKP